MFKKAMLVTISYVTENKINTIAKHDNILSFFLIVNL